MTDAKRPTVDEVLANPDAHGIGWEVQELEKDKMVLTNCPVVVHLDVEKIIASFGRDFIHHALEASNSPRVRDQAIARDAVYDKRDVNRDVIKRKQIEWRLGVRAPASRAPQWGGYDGKQYGSLVEAQQASIAYLVDNGIDAEKAKTMVLAALK